MMKKLLFTAAVAAIAALSFTGFSATAYDGQQAQQGYGCYDQSNCPGYDGQNGNYCNDDNQNCYNGRRHCGCRR